MMGYGYYGAMMNEWGPLCFVTWLIVTIDLALLGIWLWKLINKN